MRKLKYHEAKLLKQVDFMTWKSGNNLRQIKIMRRYRIENREDYEKYNRLQGQIVKLVDLLKQLDPSDPVRIDWTTRLLQKTYDMGIIPLIKSLSQLETVSASAICRRRLAVVLVKLKMTETIKQATEFIRHGHVRVGPQVITDPAYHVTRSMEDFVTWADASKIRRKVQTYNNKDDDFDLFQC